MMSFFRILGVFALLVLGLVSLPLKPLQAASSVEPSQAAAGSIFHFYADGYYAGERVATWLNRPDKQTQASGIELIADGEGKLTWEWQSSSDDLGGTWQMVALGRSSRIESVISFQILQPQSPEVSLVRRAEPVSGPPGTLFMLSANSFLPDERIETWANSPSLQEYDVPTWVFANAEGLATWQWQAPENAEGGVWQLVGRGATSRAEALIQVEIVNGAPAPEPEPSQTGVSPSSGVAGTQFSFFAAGFAPEERANYWATAPDGEVLTNADRLETDEYGELRWQWTAPASAKPGLWTMTVQGAGSRVVHQISFGIAEQPSEPLPPDGVIPAAGPPGTSFVFGVSGYEFEAHLTYWTIDPNGNLSSQAPRLRADRNGHAEFTWVAPEDAVGGVWQMVVYGLDSRITKHINFTILRDEAPAPREGASPVSVAPGETISFFVEGLPRHILLGFWATDPSGRVVPSGREIKAGGDGRVEWSWRVPEDAQAGLWTMTVRRSQGDHDNAPEVTRTIRFEVR